MDLEDFLVSYNLLPLGSMIFVLFCVKKNGWGWENFRKEANDGKGLKISNKLQFYMTYISPGTFNEVKSTDLTTAVVMGGINSISGPILCGFFLILLPEVLRSLIEWRLVIYGLIFVLVMIFKPEGLFGYKELPFEKVTAFAKKLIKPRGKEDTMEKCAKDRRPTIRGGKK